MVNIAPKEHTLVKSAELLGAMSNAKRLLILSLLSRNELSVNTLAEKVGLRQSALSQHLSKLRLADLVSTRRDAQTIYYSNKSAAVVRLLKVLESIATEGEVCARRLNDDFYGHVPAMKGTIEDTVARKALGSTSE